MPAGRPDSFTGCAWTLLEGQTLRTYRGVMAKFQPRRRPGALRSFSRRGLAAWRPILAAAVLFSAAATATVRAQPPADGGTIRLVALGDSLTAGLGIAESEAFPAQLQRALAERGYKVEIVNAGVSGDTASGGLSRLDWSVPDGSDGVIVELGANDALRGVDPEVTRKALDGILTRLKERNIPALLSGMRAPPNMGPDYAARFDAIYPDLAKKHGVLLYPFFLEGVAAERPLNQRDGIHPTAEGVRVIVRGILPKVEQLIATARGRAKP